MRPLHIKKTAVVSDLALDRHKESLESDLEFVWTESIGLGKFLIRLDNSDNAGIRAFPICNCKKGARVRQCHFGENKCISYPVINRFFVRKMIMSHSNV